MIYQFPLQTAIYITLFDIVLIGLTFGASVIRRKIFRRLALTFVFLIFGGLSLLKLLAVSPAALSSSPNDLLLTSDSNIGTFYLARNRKSDYFIFWKGFILDKTGTLTIEMEGTYPDQLRILKKINGEFKEMQPDLTLLSNNCGQIKINMSNSEFSELSNKGELAINQVWKRNTVNYASNLLSILFLVSFVLLYRRKTSNDC